MAMKPFPQEEMEKVLASQRSWKPLLRCSDTIQDSNAVKRSEVDSPPRIRPTTSVGMLGTCSIRLITI